MARVYLETSFVSACVTNRTDAASTYRRDTSREWWDRFSRHHDLFVSGEVVLELSHPRYPRSAEALNWIKDVPVIPVSDEIRGLAKTFVRERLMPAPATGDAVHVAAACVHGIEYILSWNVRHLANPNKLTHLRTICIRLALLPPQIITPDLLWEST
jgi:hypothetical protein